MRLVLLHLFGNPGMDLKKDNYGSGCIQLSNRYFVFQSWTSICLCIAYSLCWWYFLKGAEERDGIKNYESKITALFPLWLYLCSVTSYKDSVGGSCLWVVVFFCCCCCELVQGFLVILFGVCSQCAVAWFASFPLPPMTGCLVAVITGNHNLLLSYDLQ